MTVEEARKIIDEANGYVDFIPSSKEAEACVDGWFTADELEAIAVLMRVGEEI